MQSTSKDGTVNKKYFVVPIDKFEQMMNLPVEGKSVTVSGNTYNYNFYESAYLLLKEYFPNLVIETELNIQTGIGCIIKLWMYNNDTGEISECLYHAVTGTPFQGWKGLRDPDARNVTDSLVRAKTKLIAFVTGIGFSAYQKDSEQAYAGEQQQQQNQTPYAQPAQTPQPQPQLQQQFNNWDGLPPQQPQPFPQQQQFPPQPQYQQPYPQQPQPMPIPQTPGLPPFPQGGR